MDKHWFELQLIDKWFLLAPIIVVQKEDYSDIEKMRVNYIPDMMNLKVYYNK